MRKIDQILDDIKNYKSIPNDSVLAILLGVKANTISTWRSRETIPYKKLVAFANEENIDINDILENDFSEWYKKGEQKISEGVVREPIIPYGGPERRKNWPYTQEEQKFVGKLVAIMRGKNKINITAIKENINAFYATKDIEVPLEAKKVEGA